MNTAANTIDLAQDSIPSLDSLTRNIRSEVPKHNPTRTQKTSADDWLVSTFGTDTFVFSSAAE